MINCRYICEQLYYIMVAIKYYIHSIVDGLPSKKVGKLCTLIRACALDRNLLFPDQYSTKLKTMVRHA